MTAVNGECECPVEKKTIRQEDNDDGLERGQQSSMAFPILTIPRVNLSLGAALRGIS